MSRPESGSRQGSASKSDKAWIGATIIGGLVVATVTRSAIALLISVGAMAVLYGITRKGSFHP